MKIIPVRRNNGERATQFRLLTLFSCICCSDSAVPCRQNSSEKTTAVVTNGFSVRRRPSLSCLIHAVLAVSNALAAATAPRATAVTVETRTLLASRVTSRATNRVTSS